MLIIIDNHGQMCNRLWAMSPFIALAKEYDTKIAVCNFEEYKQLFSDDYPGVNLVYPSGGFFNKYLLQIARILVYKNIITKNKRFFGLFGIRHIGKGSDINDVHKYIKDRYVIVDSWRSQKDNAMLAKHTDTLRNIFMPADGYKARVDETFSGLRNQYDTVVGVHIRRGDYKNWKEGKYFYGHDDYAAMLRQFKELMPAKKLLFYICSNEKIEAQHYEGIDYYVAPQATSVEDLYALSKCDYIMGPPSTFSMWASFHGGVPISYIHTADQSVALENFSPIVKQNVQANGRHLWD